MIKLTRSNILKTLIPLALIYASINLFSFDLESHVFVSKNHQLRPSNKWAINGIVALYSSIITFNNNIEIETLSFIDHRKFNTNHLKCLINVKNKKLFVKPTEILSIQLMGTKHGINKFYRIKCPLNIGYVNDINDVYVAVVHTLDYSNIETSFNVFQKPKGFNRLNPKKHSIVNCVHMINSLDDVKLKKLFNWIQIHSMIGYEKLKLYFYDAPNNVTQLITDKYKDFVQVIDYKIGYDETCQVYLDKVKNKPGDSNLVNLLSLCNKTYELFFKDMKDLMIRNLHERMNSNDCLLQSRYEYQFLSNYDFDEFILPRHYSTDYALSFNGTNCSSNEKPYKMMDFIDSLTRKHGSKISYFKFENVLFLDRFDLIRKQMVNLTSDKTVISYENGPCKLKFTIESKQDFEWIEGVNRNEPYVSCLNASIVKNDKLYQKLNNLYGSLVNNREGKSIYNTDYTESYNQHFAWKTSSGTKSISVSLKDGYVNHFRDHDLEIDKQYELNKLFFDIEYYKFLHQLAKSDFV